MSKTFFYIILTLFLIISAGYLLLGKTTATNTGNEGSGNVQESKLWVNGGSYVLSPSEFRKDVPVRIEADMSKMPGCSKSIVISAFGVRKTLTSGDNIIEFTPDKTGTFTIACSMNMYRGTFSVV